MGTGKKPSKDVITGAILASARPCGQRWTTKGTSESATLRPQGWAFVPRAASQLPGYTQAFMALHRASRADIEASAWQDKPLRVTGASPQEQTPQRLGGGCASEGWVVSSSHCGNQLLLTRCLC